MSLPHWEVARRGAGRRGEASGSLYCGVEGGRLSGNGNEGLGHHGETGWVRFMFSVRGKGGLKELGKSTTANKAQLNSDPNRGRQGSNRFNCPQTTAPPPPAHLHLTVMPYRALHPDWVQKLFKGSCDSLPTLMLQRCVGKGKASRLLLSRCILATGSLSK